jgi:hypothetical protein
VCELRRHTACLLASLPPPHQLNLEALGQRLKAACPLAWQAVLDTEPSWHLLLLDDPVLRLQRVEGVVHSVLDPTALQDRALQQSVRCCFAPSIMGASTRLSVLHVP